MTQEMDKLLNERRKLVDNVVNLTMVIDDAGGERAILEDRIKEVNEEIAELEKEEAIEKEEMDKKYINLTLDGSSLRREFKNLNEEIEWGRRRNWAGAEEPNEEQVRSWRRDVVDKMLLVERKEMKA